MIDPTQTKSLAQQIAETIPQLNHLELYTLRNLMMQQEIKLEREAKQSLQPKGDE